MTNLEPLLDLQERDLALDRLRHRHATIPERAALAAAQANSVELSKRIDALRTERDGVARDEQRLDDEARSLAEQAELAEKRLYSGEITSPKELQALQADIEQLRRHQRGIEDREIALMEQREPLDAQLAELEQMLAANAGEEARIGAALTAAEADIDAEVAVEADARAEIASGIDPDLVVEYERCRAKANGVGAARLVGNTCQGCHLSVPATEVDRIRKGADGPTAFCDNCGTILVP